MNGWVVICVLFTTIVSKVNIRLALNYHITDPLVGGQFLFWYAV